MHIKLVVGGAGFVAAAKFRIYCVGVIMITHRLNFRP